MLSAGVELKMIPTTLRHSWGSTTADIYAHVLDDVQHQAAARMDVMLRTLEGAADGSVDQLGDLENRRGDAAGEDARRQIGSS
ncbi:MAG: hypothetical protein ACLPVY_05245 [Acidimicrobiia bacterium]